MLKPSHGRNRVVIENVAPQVECGAHPAGRILGDKVSVTAAIYADGHDRLTARVLYRHRSESHWRFVEMKELGNDMWSGSFTVDRLGVWSFTLEAWIDQFESWAGDLRKRIAAQASRPSTSGSGALESGGAQSTADIAIALRTGAILLEQSAARAHGGEAGKLRQAAHFLEAKAQEQKPVTEYPLNEEIHRLMTSNPDLSHATRCDFELPLRVDRERARFSAWYELFPRSASPIPGQHGTFADVERQLPEIAAMGFDILYLPPIHPIGRALSQGPEQFDVAPRALREVRGQSATAEARDRSS